ECSHVALVAFFAATPVGSCRSSANDFAPTPSAPRSLANVPSTPGVAGAPGRTLTAAVDSIRDLEHAIVLIGINVGGVPVGAHFGGLRGGDVRITKTTAVLSRYSYIPGVQISGTISTSLLLRSKGSTATITVSGSAAAAGQLRVSSAHHFSGVLGGHAFSVHLTATTARAAQSRGEGEWPAARPRGPRPPPRTGQPGPRPLRLPPLPLVSRDGPRVLRGPAHRGADERELRLREGRPRGAPGRGRHLHGGRPGHDRARRLAVERLSHARAASVLRRHLLPARSAPRHARMDAGAAGDRRGVGGQRRGDTRPGLRRGRAALGRRAPRPLRRAAPGERARGSREKAGRVLRCPPRRLRRSAEVPTRLGHRVP